MDGPLAGKRLTRLIHHEYFWFAWAAFRPDTVVYGLENLSYEEPVVP